MLLVYVEAGMVHAQHNIAGSRLAYSCWYAAQLNVPCLRSARWTGTRLAVRLLAGESDDTWRGCCWRLQARHGGCPTQRNIV